MQNISFLDELRVFMQKHHEEHVSYVQQNRIQGENEGRMNLPSVADKNLLPQEWQIIAVYQSKVEKANGLVRQMLHDIRHNFWQPAVTDLVNWSKDWVAQQVLIATQIRDRRLQESAENHFDRLKVLENTTTYTHAKREIAAVNNRLEAAASKLGRFELHQKIHPFWAMAIAVSIGILEIPLNNQVFALFRDPNTTMTLLLSLSLVVVMPILAHVCGRLFRQGSERTSNYFIASVLSLGIMVLSYFAAELRTEVIKDAPLASMPFFFTLNILFFAAAAMASFQAHDPSIALSDAHHALRRTQRRHARTLIKYEGLIRAETDRFQNEKEAIQREFAVATAAAQNSRTLIHKNGHEAAALYNQVLSLGQGLERTLQTYCHATIMSRREENLKFRTNHAQPISWEKPLPALTITLDQVPEIAWPGN